MRETFIRIENMKAVLPWCFTIGLVTEIMLCGQGASSDVSSPVIVTNAGSFQGLKLTPVGQDQAVYAFLGIPYAEPPIGPLRFKMPKPIDSIPGIFQATKKPPCCIQLETDIPLIWADHSSPMSEDCLYLNIWTPERYSEEERLKPVMVYIHGGGFTTASTAMDIYDAQIISALGGVVFVTLNYRLTRLGFFNSLTDDAPGNAAIYDQLLALHWVNANIEYFGGDPNRVTLLGESAGAISVGLLALSPSSDRLFQRIIIQSASPYTAIKQNPFKGAQNGNELARLVGCANNTFTLLSHPEEVVTCLRDVPASELTKTFYEKKGSSLQVKNLVLELVFEDGLISSIYKSKNFTSYDVLIGVTRDEGISMFPYAFREVFQNYIEGKLILNKTFATSLLRGFFGHYDFLDSEKATSFYLKDVGEDEQSVVRAIYEALGDFFIVCPTVYFAEKYSERGGKVQFYRFDRRPSVSSWPEWMGVAHFEEIQFLFGMPIRYPERYQNEEIKLSEYMIDMWTNFAKSKELTLKNGSQWPEYSRWNPEYATLNTKEQIVGTGERMDECEFWRPYFDA